jgi:methylated-DNA-[protein]-cysteine S-methyltransferase
VLDEIGMLYIIEEEGFISEILFENSNKSHKKQASTPLIKKANKQLKEYFNGKRKKFSLPLKIEGTDFQKSVWEQMEKIPYGKTASYKDLAIAIGKPNAARAVGMACNRNKIPIVIPCHRIIGQNKKLVGYAGGLNIKTALLELEKHHYK